MFKPRQEWSMVFRFLRFVLRRSVRHPLTKERNNLRCFLEASPPFFLRVSVPTVGLTRGCDREL